MKTLNLKIIIAAALMLISKFSFGQYVESGTIEYVRTVNLHLTMKLEMENEMNKETLEQVLKMVPKNATKMYQMTFDKNKSFFRYDKDGPEVVPSFGGKDPASENMVVQDFNSKTYKAQKEIVSDVFIINDTLPTYQWIIHDEMRQIAGYSCRKATTKISDSVVVVAYYTDQIMVSGGPESFNGLPGMILGLAVPRLYTSWFAKEVKVESYNATLEKPFIDKKTKLLNNKELNAQLSKALVDWGKFGTQILYKAIL